MQRVGSPRGLPTIAMTRRGLAITIVGVLLAGALAAALLQALADPPPAAAPHDLRTSNFFAVLRTPPVDVRSRAVEGSLASAAVVEPRSRFTDAHLASEEPELWVLSSHDSICIAQPKAAACAPEDVAIREGVFLGTFLPPTRATPTPHDFLLQGLAPDGVARARVIVGKSRRFTVPIRNNVFSVKRNQPVRVERLLRAR